MTTDFSESTESWCYGTVGLWLVAIAERRNDRPGIGGIITTM